MATLEPEDKTLEVPIDPSAAEGLEVAGERPSFDLSQLSDEQVEALLADEATWQRFRRLGVVDRRFQSERDTHFEAYRKRAEQSQRQADESRKRAERSRWILEGDPDDVRERLYEEAQQHAKAVGSEEAVSEARTRAQQEASGQYAQYIAAHFSDLPEADKRQLQSRAELVVRGELPEEQLVREAFGLRDAHQRRMWEAESQRLRKAEQEAAAASRPRLRPDLGGSSGGGRTWSTMDEVEAAFRAGQATLDDVRWARQSNLPYTRG